ncbi:MAG TPA: c-type cytochrome, partial [Polyangia bacterium]
VDQENAGLSSSSGGAIGFFGGAAPLQLGATVTPADPPPVVSGGTLRVLRDGHTAVASDPDRDQISVVDLTAGKVSATIALMKGDEPGRIVEDGAGRVHVSLRGAGAILTLDPGAGTVLGRRSVCSAPRGIAYDAKSDQLHVACSGGELVTLPSASGAATRTLKLDRDLRDVVVDGDQLLVSRFRSAQILTVDADGKVTQRLTPAPLRSPEVHFGQLFSAAVAWRMVEMPGGGAAVMHQRGMDDQVETRPGGYGNANPCDSIVHSAVTVVKGGEASESTPAIAGMVLPTDMAISPDGKRVALIATGNATNAQTPGGDPELPRVFVTDLDSLVDRTVGCRSDGRHGPCLPSLFGGTGGVVGTGGSTFSGSGGSFGTGGTTGTGGARGDACDSTRPAGGVPVVSGEPTAVAFDGAGAVVVQTREPAALFLASGATVSLSSQSRADTGHTVFHGNAGGFVACASCHPEGSDDGRVWSFSCEGTRRTQSLAAPLAGTEPFHWGGDMKTFSQIMSNVFVGRMSGPKLTPEQIDATFTWIDRHPRQAATPASDPAAAERGRALFQDPKLACASCHTGPSLTNNMTTDVGTGGLFQVPSLRGVGARAPFMHTGCAKTLADRFNPACGGGDKHGVTSGLTSAQIADLVAYMETL